MTRAYMLGLALLFGTAAIWGAGFVAQRQGANTLPPLTFNAVRFLIGSLSILPVILMFSRPRAQSGPRHALLGGGMICGIFLFAGINLQQTALQFTTAGKAAFITGLYIILVPIIGRMFGRRIGAKVWIAAAVSVTGLYFLSVTDGLRLAPGDGLVMLCSLFWALQVLATGKYAPLVDGPRFALVQFMTVAILSVLGALLTESVHFAQILTTWWPLLFSGVVATGVAFTFQILAQARVPATPAALIMSLETVFGALAGWFFLHETLGAAALTGCALMFAGIIIAQLPGVRRAKPIRLWVRRS